MQRALICLLLLMGCLVLVPAMAQADRHGGGLYRVEAYRLVFNEDQNKKLDALLAPGHQDFLPLFKDRATEQQKLQDMLKTDTATDADIRAQVTKISDIDYQIALKKATFIRSIRKIATPEQLAKIDALEAKRIKRHQKMMESRGTPPAAPAAPASN